MPEGRHTPPVGREAELHALAGLLDAARLGDGRLAWVEGEPGIGKTALADAATTLARERGFAIHGAGAAELDGNRPFRTVAEALGVTENGVDDRRAAVARALAEEPGALSAPVLDRSERERWLVEQLVAVAEDTCAAGPVLLVLDDMQWADPSSLRLLGRLAHSLADLPLLVLAAARTAPRPPALDRLMVITTGLGAVRLTLGPLTGSETTALFTVLAEREPEAELNGPIAACGGNPLYVGELVRSLDADGRLTANVAESLAQTVLGRLGYLEPEALRLLELASVVGSAFSVVDLALLAGRPAAELWPDLRTAVRSGFLVEHGERLAFRHDVVREVLYAEMPAATRAALHLELGRALAAADAPPGRVAEHLARGAQPGDRDAVTWLVRAARRAAYSGPEVAVGLLRTALDLAAPDDPDRGQLTAELAFDLLAAGQRDEGEQLCLEALEIHPDGEGALRLCLTESLMARGQLADALAEAGRVVASGGTTGGERAHALAWQALGPMFAKDVAGAAEAGERARAAGAAAGEVVAEVKGLVVCALSAGFRGDLAAQEVAARQASDAAERAPSRAVYAGQPHVHHALALAELDRFDEARRQAAHAGRAYDRLGMETQSGFVNTFLGYVLECAGEWDDALAELEASAVASRQSEVGWQLDPMAIRAVIHARRDELVAAEAILADMDLMRTRGAIEFRLVWSPLAVALVREGRDDPVAATEGLWAIWEQCRTIGLPYEQSFVAGDLSRLLAAAGDTERARVVAEQVEALAAGNPGPASLHALALRCRAQAEGDTDGLVSAASAAAEAARPYEAVASAGAAVQSLASEGRREEAREWGEAGLERAEALGAARDAARIRAALRAAGVRRGSRGARTRAATGWESLTPGEARVAELVAEGLSNPQVGERLFISSRTVSTHVSSILRKLELRSRVQLAARAAARDEDTSVD